MSDILAAIQQQNKEENAKKNIFTFKRYKNRLTNDVSAERNKKEYERKYSKDLIFREDLKDGESCNLRISPELNIVWERIKREKNSDRARELVKQLLEEDGVCRRVTVDGMIPGTNLWYATTENGIDIRPGVVDGENEPKAVRLGDDCVHALMAGRTGSGKSNALHVIITSLMYEYAPWELNINLADFKIVELSKYGNSHYTDDKGLTHLAAAPHVEKIAATDSMEYVLSVMYDMYEKMDIRQKVFAALGFQKLSQYRKEYNVVLPREILIVDEFQQMYELATPKQAEKINRLIKMITKLGRATGYHLLFASQSMSGTVRADVLANFKLRLCLPADENVSVMVLGNKAAAELTGNESKGYLIANGEGGSESYNIKYRVPLIEENEDKGIEDLRDTLRENAKLAAEMHYSKDLDFYREEAVRPLWRAKKEESSSEEPSVKESSLEENLQVFYCNTRSAVKDRDHEDVEDYLLLGDSCVYNRTKGKQSSLEYIPLKIGDRKNILCLGDSIYQRAYMIELLSLQYAKRGTSSRNYIVHGDSIVRSLLRLPGFQVEREFAPKDITEFIRKNYRVRSMLQWFSQLPEERRTAESLPQESRDIIWSIYQKGLRENGEFRFKELDAMTFWINGYHMLGDLIQEWGQRAEPSMDTILKNGVNVGMRFVLVGTKAADLPSGIARNFEYRFLMSNDESNFVKSGMQYPKEYKEELLRVKVMNEALNRQKPGLYILPQDEKLVKTFSVDLESGKNEEEIFFKGISG